MARASMHVDSIMLFSGTWNPRASKAPTPGLDDNGKEILSWIPGKVPVRPYPKWALSETALASVGRLLHSHHQAVPSFDFEVVSGLVQ
jgi:hypothetical protein